MNRVLLVSGSNAGLDSLSGLLRNCAYTDIGTAVSGAEARRILLGREYETVLINVPLADEVGDALAADIARTYFAGVIMIVKSELAELTAARVENSGVLVISKPLQRRELLRAMRMTETAGMRVAALKAENRKLRKKLEEIRVISRAKCLLIEKRGMTEETAHKYIEKRAMDTRVTRCEAAMEVLRELEY